MSQISESTPNQTQISGALRDGMEALDLNQQITYQAYTRVVLPVDGYVFWQPTVSLTVKGSLHFSQEMQQNEDETLGFATVTFSSEGKIVQFEDAPPNTIYVARCGKFRYAFSQQTGFYTQAGLWHYFGHSVLPAMAAQLLDNPDSIDPTRAVTSNSLALWLALNGYKSPLYDGFSNKVTLYPSFLTPANLLPSYGAVHIGDGDTQALQAIPYLDRDRNHYQLVSDKVRITLYGLQSNEALDFVDCVLAYSQFTGNFGIMNMPIVRDGKRPQPELQAIAMQKFVDFEISYYQTRVADVARQLILSAVPTYIIEGRIT